MRDLLVAGGGPVGLAVALHAARAGLDVAVLEPRPGPIDKACGEGLMPGALARLADLGVDPPGIDLLGVRYLDAHHAAQARFHRGPGRGVRRTTLHAALAARVAEVGVPVERRRVSAVVVRADRVLVDGTSARYLVAADGLHSPIRRYLGLDDLRASRRAPRRFGQRVHLRVAPWSQHVEVHWGPRAEAYVTPVSPDLVGVAVLSAERASLEDLLDDVPRLLSRIGAAEFSTVRGAGPMRQRARRRVAGRVLLAGDAAGYVDALTGEGIALGLAEAAACVAAVVDGRPERYEADWRRLHRRHDLITTSLLAATRHGPVRRRFVQAADRVPMVFAAAVDQLARPA